MTEQPEERLTAELRGLLDAARADFEGIFEFESIDSASRRRAVEAALRRHGVVLLRGAIGAEEPLRIEADVLAVQRGLAEHYPQLAAATMGELAHKMTKPKLATGLVAAKQTGMQFVFPERKANNLSAELDGAQEPIDYQPWYAGVNLAMLRRNPRVAALLGTLGTAEDGSNSRAVSADSCKVASADNPSTLAHIDHYPNPKERVQGCLHVRRVRERELGYVPMGAALEAWLRQHCGQLYAEHGLRRLEDAMPQAWVALIEAHMVYPEARTLALWLSGTVHGEAKKPARTAANGAEYALRLYVGTHATHLPLGTLVKLADLARGGFTVSRFRHNRGSRVDAETMSKGSTGPYNVCSRSAEELAARRRAAAALEARTLRERLDGLDELALQLGGIQRSLRALPSSFGALLDEERSGWEVHAAVSAALLAHPAYDEAKEVRAAEPDGSTLRSRGFVAPCSALLARQQTLDAL